MAEGETEASKTKEKRGVARGGGGGPPRGEQRDAAAGPANPGGARSGSGIRWMPSFTREQELSD